MTYTNTVVILVTYYSEVDLILNVSTYIHRLWREKVFWIKNVGLVSDMSAGADRDKRMFILTPPPYPPTAHLRNPRRCQPALSC